MFQPFRAAVVTVIVLILAPAAPAAPMSSGVTVTVTGGSLDGAAPFQIRLRLAPGAEVPPHTHRFPRQLTILSGSVELGVGSVHDRSRTTLLREGQVLTLRPGTGYFLSSPAGATLAIEGMGPWSPAWIDAASGPGEQTASPLFTTIEVEGQMDRTATVTTVPRAEIERQNAYTAYDAVEYRPGLHVVRQLGLIGSGLTRLIIRGAGASGPAGLQVFLDGRPDATVSFAHPTPSAMGTENARRIEVIHGPSPVLYGSGNTGVLNLVSEPPASGTSGFVKQSIREYGTAETQVRLSHGAERGYLRLSGSYRTTDGYRPELDANVKNISLKGGIRLTEGWELSAGAAVNEDHFSPLGAFFVPGPFTDPRTTDLDLTQTVFDLTLTGRHARGSTSLKLFTDDLRARSQVLDPGEERGDVDERGMRLRTEWSSGASLTLISGIDVLRATARNSPVLPPFAGPGLAIPRPRVSESLTEYGGYLFAEKGFSPAWSLSGGIRLIQHSEYGFETAEEVGILWRPAPIGSDHPLASSTFRGRYVRGYQSPTLQQLFGVFRGGRTGPANPDLEPERVQQFELGYLYNRPRWDLDVVAFRQKGTGVITTPASPPPPPPDITNSIGFETTGVEARLRARVTGRVMVHAGLAALDLDEMSLRTPNNTFDLGLTFWGDVREPRDLVLHLAGRIAGSMDDVPVNGTQRVELDGYRVFDLNTSFRVTPNVEVFAALTNVTDEEYELVVGVPAPPRTAGGGITLRF